MASQYLVKPGTFETISNQDIGSFVLDQPQSILLDGFFPFLMANIELKQGTTVIPPSAYTLFTDTEATAQEVGKTNQTLIGQIKITNVAYAGVTLNISGNNFGTYGSNKAVRDYVQTEIATKVNPGTDPYIKAGEPAIFETSSGLSLISANSGQIAEWDAGTSYTVAGTLVRLEGITASASGEPLNQNKNPLVQVNSPFWYRSPGFEKLLSMAGTGKLLRGELHPVHDRAGSVYQQNLLIDKKKIAGVTNYFSMVHLDGTVVTGNTTLEDDIFKVGTADEYPFIDLIAPEIIGTRTLIDMGGYTTRDISAGGGVADTLAEMQMDQFEDHEHSHDPSNAEILSVTSGETSASFLGSSSGAYRNATIIGLPSTGNHGSETRVKALVTSISAVIVQYT